MDYYQEVINEYKYIKNKLISYQELLDPDTTLIFYHKTQLSKLSPGSGITPNNIKEFMHPILDSIYSFVESAKKLPYIKTGLTNTASYIALNSSIEHLTNEEPILKEILIKNIGNLKNNCEIRSNIDILNIKINVEIKDDKGQIIETKNNIYVFDFFYKSINIVDDGEDFSINSPFIFIMPTVSFVSSLKEMSIKSIDISFDLKVVYSNLKEDNYSYTLIKSNNYFENPALFSNEIAYFGVFDLFGHSFFFKENENLKEAINNTYLSSSNKKNELKKIYCNNELFFIETFEKFILFKKNSRFFVPKNIKFNVYKITNNNLEVYYPALSPLRYSIIKAINEI